ncbi:carboxyvinyl-carboxyphosphonate phosphorylmutase [Paenibacillus albidus]|uniref:Carboxyvinyl-carboxyphosphonate phosphorylmutase n=1 Tax=Paenibacillus albidus TaxID=2041023 RepID=A0A917C5B4_9BACL|nr:isocitrate lyase/phosphoenolpyruvate mutase family protein [Paenibacillus albidus]GGF70939.1 carboxyvinyl-carboxyphosphonate phosphorylmutase [Paenibacillus albidus]
MNHIQQFNELHTAEEILFLGNAWDLLSAFQLEQAGFRAIGTTSWGIAGSLGLADGELVDFDRHLGIIKSIVDHVKVPVTADLEAGYGEHTATIVHNVLKAADIGVAGINLEDSLKGQTGLRESSRHGKLLSDIRTALIQRGFKDLYINARIDTYLQQPEPLAETLERAAVYVESGASGIFVPGLKAEADIRLIAQEIHVPLNVMSLPGLTEGNTLKEWGVKRFSFGNALFDKITACLEHHAAQCIEGQSTAHLYR